MMKKILGAFVILLLILAGGLFYVRHRVAQNLSTFSQAREFKAIGLKLTIPPIATGVKGFFQPYLEVSGSQLSLDYDSQIMHWVMDKGKLTSDLWKPDSIQLVIPQWQDQKGEMQVQDLSFDLVPDGTLRRISAKHFQAHNAASGEIAKILSPSYEMGIWTGLVPDTLIVGSKGLEIGKPGSDLFQLGEFYFSLKSNKEGELRKWEVRFDGKGGKTKHASGTLDVKPWTISISGQAKDLSRQRVQDFVKNFVSTLKESFPQGLESLPSGTQLQDFFGGYQDVVDFIIEMDLKPAASLYQWGGLKWESVNQARLVMLSASEGKGNFVFEENAFSVSSDLLLDNLQVRWDEHDFKLEGTRIDYQGEWKISYSKVLSNWVLYYRNVMQIALLGGVPNPLMSLLGPISQYPEKANYQLKSDKIYYKTPETEGNHRNWSLGVKMEPVGVTFYGKGDVAQKFTKDPSQNIPDGSIDAAWTFRMPYEKVVGLSRRWVSAPEAPLPWVQELMGEKGGLEIRSNVELGGNWFGGKIDLLLLADLGKTLEFAQRQSPDSGEDAMVKGFLQEFLKDGTLNFDLLIRRFSKFQAKLEKADPSATLGLAAVIPFVQMDSAADTLSVKLELKDQQILLNGKRNEWIENQLRKLQNPN